MSHFIRCDRCDRQDTVMGQLSLPPGWQTILHADLCEPCCQIVKEFIRFKPSDAERLPVEPIPSEPAPVPSVSGDKLFETAPEAKREETQPGTTPAIENRETPSPSQPTESAPTLEAVGHSPVDETSTEERARTRKAKANIKVKVKLAGQDAILPDVRKPEPPAPDPGVQ